MNISLHLDVNATNVTTFSWPIFADVSMRSSALTAHICMPEPINGFIVPEQTNLISSLRKDRETALKAGADKQIGFGCSVGL